MAIGILLIDAAHYDRATRRVPYRALIGITVSGIVFLVFTLWESSPLLLVSTCLAQVLYALLLGVGVWITSLVSYGARGRVGLGGGDIQLFIALAFATDVTFTICIIIGACMLVLLHFFVSKMAVVKHAMHLQWTEECFAFVPYIACSYLLLCIGLGIPYLAG